MFIKLGIAYEGERDVDPLKIIIQKILHSASIEFKIVRTISPRKGIIGFISSYTKIFFKQENVDVAIFVTDQDVSPRVDDRKGRIVDLIQKVDSGVYLERSVIGLCDPHFERWLIADHNAVKKVFNLDHSVSLPFGDKSPKHQIENMKNNMTTPQPSLHDVYVLLAEELDLDMATTHCSDFKNFRESLVSVCRSCY